MNLSLNSGLYLQVVTLTTLIFCGVVQYFTGIGAVLWLPFLMTCLMVLLLPMQTRYSAFYLDNKERVLLVLFVSLFALATVSTVLQSGIKVTIVGMKNELAISLIMFCLLLGFVRESQIYRITKALYWVFYIQFPVILYQILIVVPKRVAFRGEYEKWDAVVGTFGGDPMKGGNTAAMGLFCLLIMLLKLSEYKHGLTTKLNTGLHIIAAFILCILGEVKFVILISPFLLAFVWFSPSYLAGMKRLDLKTALMIIGGLFGLISLAIMILAASYSSAFAGSSDKGALDIFIDSLSYVFDPNYIMAETGELGRMTTIFFWGEHSDLWGLPSQLFGYGLNATNRGSTVAPGFLNIIFNVFLDSTSLSMLLWEMGLIGTLLFFGVIGYTLRIVMPKPLISRDRVTQEDVRLLSFQPAFIAFGIAGLLSLPYSQTLMIVPMPQFLFYFSLGAALVIRKSVLTISEPSYG
ncbi:capsular biosynthesis protein [Vibrio sp. Hal054]|uniref:capsular biosynthesis protein n=1 Tax=Vibrio sp. Hal054 TaxID=3035158 RepID=UPI00301E1B06